MNSTPKAVSFVDLAFLVYVILGTLISLSISGILWMLSLVGYLTDNSQATDSSILAAISFTFVALFGIPAIYYGAQVALGKENKQLPPPSPYGYLFIFLFPIAFILGYLAYMKGFLTPMLAPFAQVLAAIAGVAFVIQIARQKGAILTARRFWGQFVTGLWIVPVTAITMEILILIPTIIAFGLGAMTTENGRQLLDLLSNPTSPSITTLQQSFENILLEPWFLLTILTFFSILVPLIEEALKSMIVWPLLFSRIPSAQALMGGIIGGAGYALFEAMFQAQEASTWWSIMIGRTGATLMHAFTTGITSWGLAEGFVRKRWIRTFVSYLVAVAFHGLWNANAVMVAFTTPTNTQDETIPKLLESFQVIGPIFIVILSLVAILGIPWLTRKIGSQPEETSPSSDEDTGSILA